MRRLEILSANLAIGTASVFVAFTAIASLAVDRQDGTPVREAGTGWALRGSLAPTDRLVLSRESKRDALPALPKAV